MESELLYSKERLAVERKAQQPLRSLAGESAGAGLAQMRQRLIRAEREARSARRLAIALFCASLAGMAGIVITMLPWCVAPPPPLGTRGRRGLGIVSAWAASAHEALLHGQPSSASEVPLAPLRPSDPSHASGTQPPNPSGSLSPGPARIAETMPAPAPPGKTGAHEPAVRPNSSPCPATTVGAQAAKVTPQSLHPAEPRGATSSHSQEPGHAALARPAVSSTGSRAEIPRPAPHQVAHFSREPRSGSQEHSRGFRRTVRSSGHWRSRDLWGNRRPAHYLGHSRSWRILRVSRRGTATYCLVDPHGNWWVARPVRSRASKRGDERK
jgi:hypothetical protein